MGGFAWVTLATNDSYSLGALILAHSLKQAGTPHQLAVLVTPGVTNPMREKLSGVFDLVQEVNILDSKDEANLKLLKRPELGVTFTKLHCWRLTQYEKCVFLDADTLVLQNCDELFEREELSAAPDVGWPDCFNSGVFVFRPSNETYEKLVQFALDKGSFDGGDQGLLNLYFSDWAHKDISKHLPFIYNMCSTACYSYLPAFKQFGGNAKIIHFIGPAKPWLQFFDSETRLVHPSGDLHHLQSVLQQWWNIFCEKIHPVLSRDMAGLAGAFAQLTLGAPRSAEQIALENHLRRQGWEVGNIDYLGKDSFDNIWSKICETIGEPKPATEATPAPPTPSEEPAKPKAPTSSEVQPSPAEAPVEEAPKDIPTTQVLPPTPGTPVDVQIPSTKPIEAEPLICPIKQPEPEVCPIKPPEPVVAKPETPEAVTKPDIPEAAIKPQTPEATTKPELPEAVIKPQTPEATTKPDTPEVATKPQTPEAETKAQTPEATTKPVIPEVATKPQTPEAETKPQIPEAATKPQTPEAETKPQIPETATKPQTPEAITKPQTPEATTKPDIPEAAPKPQTPEAATKPETSPVESPIVPETPPVVAAPPKAPEPSTPTPKPEEASAAAATETTATPTPPPRKGSGGSKKASKPKK